MSISSYCFSLVVTTLLCSRPSCIPERWGTMSSPFENQDYNLVKVQYNVYKCYKVFYYANHSQIKKDCATCFETREVVLLDKTERAPWIWRWSESHRTVVEMKGLKFIFADRTSIRLLCVFCCISNTHTQCSMHMNTENRAQALRVEVLENLHFSIVNWMLVDG